MTKKCTNPKCNCEPCECRQEEIDALIKERDENLNLAKYQKAEFENFKRRNAEAVTNAFSDGQTYAINAILPVYDGVIAAREKISTPIDLEGFEIIKRKLEEIFNRLGVEEIPTIGEKFNPKLHNAVAVEKVNGKEADIVLEEWQKGFTLHGRVLRPSTVKVTD